MRPFGEDMLLLRCQEAATHGDGWVQTIGVTERQYARNLAVEGLVQLRAKGDELLVKRVTK